MKTKDMRTGVLYAYRTSRHDAPKPIVVLSTDLHIMRRHRRPLAREAPTFARNENPHVTRCLTDQYADNHYGYPAVTNRGPHQHPDAERVDPAVLLDVDLAALSDVPPSAWVDPLPDAPGVYGFVIDPRFIVGEWEAVLEARRADRELAADLKRIEDERRAAVMAERGSVTDRLQGLNLPGPADYLIPASHRYGEHRATTITLSVDQMRALLSLVPAGASVPEGAWEYETGEGRHA